MHKLKFENPPAGFAPEVEYRKVKTGEHYIDSQGRLSKWAGRELTAGHHPVLKKLEPVSIKLVECTYNDSSEINGYSIWLDRHGDLRTTTGSHVEAEPDFRCWLKVVKEDEDSDEGGPF